MSNDKIKGNQDISMLNNLFPGNKVFPMLPKISEDDFLDKSDIGSEFEDKMKQIVSKIDGEAKSPTSLIPVQITKQNENLNKLYETSQEKFDQEVEALLSFLEELGKNESFSVAFIERRANYVYYGKYEQGFKINEGTFLLTSNEGFKAIYELLQIRFADSFDKGFKHTFGQGWSLLPVIASNVVVEIESHNQVDSNWIYAEVQKDRSTKQYDEEVNKLKK